MTYIIYEVWFKEIKDYLHVHNFPILPLFFSLYIQLIHADKSGQRRIFLNLLTRPTFNRKFQQMP